MKFAKEIHLINKNKSPLPPKIPNPTLTLLSTNIFNRMRGLIREIKQPRKLEPKRSIPNPHILLKGSKQARANSQGKPMPKLINIIINFHSKEGDPSPQGEADQRKPVVPPEIDDIEVSPYLTVIISRQTPEAPDKRHPIDFPNKAKLNNLRWRTPSPPSFLGLQTSGHLTREIFDSPFTPP